jgi:hypothetical protein
MANEKNDQSVLSHIDQLVKEEERLEVKVALDQCWDLLAAAEGFTGVWRRPGQGEGASGEDCEELRAVETRKKITERGPLHRTLRAS